MYSSLASLPIGGRGHVAAVDWDSLSLPEGRRLRELGMIEGATVELLHRGSLFLKDPISVRVGRTTIIIRTVHAQAVSLVREGAG